MKTQTNPLIRLSSLIAAASIAFSATTSAVTWQWDGGASTSNWQTATNWNPDSTIASFNGTHADRLNVNGSQLLDYTAAEGVTNYGTAGVRGLVVGSGSSGTMTISGGTFSSLNASGSSSQDIVGNVNGAVGILNISGGTFIGASTGTFLGIGTGTGRVSTFNVSSGKATITTLNLNSSDADVNLSGTGELEVNTISMTAGSTGNISFNGGTLRARTATTSFMQGLTGATINGGGATVDSNGNNITIAQSLLAGTGAGGLTKTGAGILTLTGTNTYTGATTLSAGTLSVAATAHLGASASSLVFDGGTLQITGGTLTSFSGIGHSVSFVSGKTVGIDINASSTTFTADQILNQGVGGLTKLGAGKLVLNQNNTYSGATTISAGAVIKDLADSATGDLSVASGASLVLRGGVTDGSGQSLTLDGGGINTGGYFFSGSAVLRGALQAQSGSNTWAGDIVVNSANTRIGVQDGGSLTLTGTITGTSPLFRAGNSGSDIVLNGTASWTGTTSLFSAGGAIRIDGNNKLSSAASAYFSSGGSTVFDLNGNNQEFAGFSSDGVLANATITNKAAATTSTLTSNTPTETSFAYRGGIADGDGIVSLTKTGAGTQILTATNTYTGDTTVSAGILAVNGSLANTSTTVGNTGTLRGSGSIGGSVTVQNGGTIAAGNSIESLATGTLTLNGGATFAYEIDNDALAAAAGDLTAVTGNLNFDLANGTILSLSELGTGSWDLGAKLTLISYSGAWNGGLFDYNGGALADDSTFSFSGIDWLFNYNDISAGSNYTGDLTGSSFVTMTAVPEPAAATLGLLGFVALLRRRRP